MTISTRKRLRLDKIVTLAHQDFSKALNTHAYFRTSDHLIGEDMVQDTFVKTWAYLVKGGKIDQMRAFLFHILNNLIVDQYRKRKRISLDSLREKGFEPSVDDSERLTNQLDGQRAFLLLNQLSAKNQKILRMRFEKGLSLKEISLINKQSINTVTVQIHRALKKLRLLTETK
jgi:RNA polymerase sigma factor (sigma-70 family)